MADCFPAIKAFPMYLIKSTLLVFALLCMLLLAGCESVPMPDMSTFDFELLKEKPLVSIKQGYSKVNIRPSASTEMPPVATLNGGDKIKLYEEKGDWLKVTFYDTAGQEQEGWIYKYLVEGYNKPVVPEPISSRPHEQDTASDIPAIEAVEIEQNTNEQELPKSESVSPL